MQETQVWSLGQKDPLEKEMATHSSVLAWRIPWTEEPGRQQSVGLQRAGHNWGTNTALSYILSPFCTIQGDELNNISKWSTSYSSEFMKVTSYGKKDFAHVINETGRWFWIIQVAPM